MSAPTLTLRWATDPASELTFTGGRLTALTTAAGRIIDRLDPVAVIVDGVRHELTPQVSEAYDDELVWQAEAAGLGVQVRHDVDRTWQLRVRLTNLTDQTLTVDAVDWELAAGEQGLALVHAAGASGALFFADDGGGVLGLRLARGDLIADGDRLRTPALTLAPGESWSLALAGQWYADLAAAQALIPAWWPPATLDERDAPDLSIDHDDAAITVPDSLAPGVRTWTINDARGTAYATVAIAPAFGATLETVAHRLSAPLAGAAQAVIAQAAPAGIPAADLLAEYAERTPDGPAVLRAVVWARQGDLERAYADLAATVGEPGWPMGLLAAWSAALICGQDTGPLAALAAGHRPDSGLVAQSAADLLSPRPGHEVRRRRVHLIATADPAGVWPPLTLVAAAQLACCRQLAGAAEPELTRRVLAAIADLPIIDDSAQEALAWLAVSGAWES